MAAESKFTRQALVSNFSSDESFSPNDVGVFNPLNDSYIRLEESGEVEIYSGNGVGIFMNPKTKAITFIADCVKFITREEDGLRWNNNSFNSQATSYTEPSLVPYNNDDVPSIYRDIDDFLGEAL